MCTNYQTKKLRRNGETMSRGIIIFGSAGAGKTTLGKLVAKQLGYPYFDIDDYIWRKDTQRPYTMMYSKEEKAGRLLHDISEYEHFVMAGSMDSFHDPFDPLFDLAVHITADSAVRFERIQQRAINRFGERILEGGDLYEGHQKFIESAMRYDTSDASPNLQTHLQWASTLPCKVLFIDGADTLENNTTRIIEEYQIQKELRNRKQEK